MRQHKSHSGVRWRPDVGYELRCLECARASEGVCFWPLTPEFWDRRRGFSRCRACWKRQASALRRAAYAKAPTVIIERSRRYRAEVGAEAQRVKNRAKWQAIKADPLWHESVKEQGRIKQREYRARKRRQLLKAA